MCCAQPASRRIFLLKTYNLDRNGVSDAAKNRTSNPRKIALTNQHFRMYTALKESAIADFVLWRGTNMKIGVVALAAIFAGQAFGSYELLYVVDRDTTGNRIHRFDGDTGAYLGGFGVDLTNTSPNGIAINSKGEVFAVDTNKIFVYDGSTGGLIREFAKPGVSDYSSLSMTSTGDLLVANLGGNGYRVSAVNGAVLSTYTRPGGGLGVAGLFQGPGGQIFGAISGINKVQRYQLNGTADTLSGVTDSLLDCEYGTVSGNIGYLATGTAKKVVRFDMSTSPATILSSFSMLATEFALTGLAAGHGNRMFMSVFKSGGGGYIQRFDKTDGTLRGAFGSTILSRPTNMVCVVAPEPASLLVLGAAIGCLCLRRLRTR